MGCVIVLNVIKFIFLRLLQYLHWEFSPQTLIPLYLQFFSEKISCFRVSAFLKSQHHDFFHQYFFRWCLHDNNWRRNPFWRLVGFILNLHATDRLARAIHDRNSNANMSSYTAASTAFTDFIFSGKIFMLKHIWFVKCQSIWKKFRFLWYWINDVISRDNAHLLWTSSCCMTTRKWQFEARSV